MTTLLALTLAYAGFTAVCLAMDRHHRQVWGRPAARRIATLLRASGFVLLALALLACLMGFPGSLGVVVWFGVLTATAMPLVFLLPYAPRAVAAAAVCSLPAAAVVAMLWT